jgi:hypothetical protein
MLERLNAYYEKGLVYKQVHPSLPLVIWNYSEKVQYEGLWDELTLMCRGLITDNTGNVIVKPFGKFFNYEEVEGQGLVPWSTSEYVYIQEKMDGSLGILFKYEGNWIMATRGSFTSDQAIKGLEIATKEFGLNYSGLEPSFAYLVEIIYPDNRIVVDYGKKETVVVLSAVKNLSYNWGLNADAEELHWTTTYSVLKGHGVKTKNIVKTEQFFTLGRELYMKLKSENLKNKEGYILRFHPSNYRVKIKFEEYVRLHRIMTQISTTNVWDLLRNGGSIEDILVDVPDEFYKKIKEYVSNLKYSFWRIKEDIGKAYDYKMYGKYGDEEPVTDRKEFAEWVLTQPKHYHAVLFRMFSKRDYDEIIWKLIRPEYKPL